MTHLEPLAVVIALLLFKPAEYVGDVTLDQMPVPFFCTS